MEGVEDATPGIHGGTVDSTPTTLQEDRSSNPS